MLARIVWITFAACALVLLPTLFYLRYGRWPILSSFTPRDTYMLVNFLHGVAEALYTIWLLFGREPKAVSSMGGLAMFACGSALCLWAVVTMGPNWRMGQDPSDQSVYYVSSGPFRLLRHPIYAGLVIISLGQGLLTGFDGRAVLLIAASVLYFIVQGRAESRYWEAKRRPS